MKWLFLFLLSFNLYASDYKKISHTYNYSKASTSWNVGYSSLKNSKDVFNIELDSRYSFVDSMGLHFGVKKWLSNSDDINDDSGNLAIQTNLGFIFALSGSLIKTKEELIYYKLDKKRFRKFRKIRYHKDDGLRMELNVANYELSKLENSVTGFNYSLFYEYNINRNSNFNFGLKHDIINHKYVKFNIIQGFIGVTFTP